MRVPRQRIIVFKSYKIGSERINTPMLKINNHKHNSVSSVRISVQTVQNSIQACHLNVQIIKQHYVNLNYK